MEEEWADLANVKAKEKPKRRHLGLRWLLAATLRQWWSRIRHGHRYAFKPRWLRRAFREEVEPWNL